MKLLKNIPISLVLCIFLFSVLLQALPNDEETVHIKLGIINERIDNPDFTFQQYHRFHTYLSQKLAEKEINMAPLVITQNVQDMENAISANSVNVLMETVMTSLSIMRNTNLLQPVLLGWRKGQRQYYSVFFVRKDSEIETLDDLRGHNIAFESPRSTSAFLVPLGILQEQGITISPIPDADNEAIMHYLFAGSELNQAYWVQRGKTKAAAFNDGDWLRIPEHIRRDLRIIHQSKPIVRWLVSFHSDLAPKIKQMVVQVLLEMHEDPEGVIALQDAENITRFENLNADDMLNLDHWKGVLNKLGSLL